MELGKMSCHVCIAWSVIAYHRANESPVVKNLASLWVDAIIGPCQILLRTCCMAEEVRFCERRKFRFKSIQIDYFLFFSSASRSANGL